MAGRAGIWTGLIEAHGRRALGGHTQSAEILRRLAQSQTGSGGFSNLANDYLRQSGDTSIPYVDESRQKAGALGLALKGGAPIVLGTVAGAGLLGGLGGAAGAGGKGVSGLAKVPGVTSGGGGLLGRIGDFITSDPGRAIRLGLGGIGAIQASQAAGRANDLQRRALAPLFGGGVNPYADLPVDEGNPYASTYRRPRGQAALRAELAR